MVGYAFSADKELGYNNVLIKSYDCDDLLFVNEGTPMQVYCVCRNDLSVKLIYCSNIDDLRHLKYNDITEICKKLFEAEYKSDYPQSVLWSITPSGVCEIKSKEDYNTIWPLTPYHLSLDVGYISIDSILSDSSLLYLKSTFVADVINEATYCSGIYVGDIITVIGDELFITFDGACVLKSLFKDSTLWKICSEIGKSKKVKNLNRQKILKTIKDCNSVMNYEHDFDSKELCNIKTECIYDVVCIFKTSLENNYPVNKLTEQIKSVFDKSFKKIDMQKENFVFYSGGRSSSDMNYLSFDDLMMTFAFGKFKKEMADKIKINRQRKHALKELTVPKVIYKGKLYFQ